MRTASFERNTTETQIFIQINVDGCGNSKIETGIGFLDHMLTLFAFHGNFDITLQTKGDLNVDCHHTVEDIGLSLGLAFCECIKEKNGISRYGSIVLPMDETLLLVSLDISGRPYLGYDVSFSIPRLGEMDTELFLEFFRSFSNSFGINLHFKSLTEKNNNHHLAEAMFKGLGRALSSALSITMNSAIPSTKGVL